VEAVRRVGRMGGFGVVDQLGSIKRRTSDRSLRFIEDVRNIAFIPSWRERIQPATRQIDKLGDQPERTRSAPARQ